MTLNFKIHRGSNEIGGSCVDVWTENTRILIDFGMPLVEKNGSEFNFNKYKNLSVEELLVKGILPNIKNLYGQNTSGIDGILISHAHQDHFGLINYVNPAVKFYLGEATHKIIELNNTFTNQDITIQNPVYFDKENPFQIGDFIITPYWTCHSAFDAYSFLIEANGQSIFYSGDFRGHGRKSNAFNWFLHNTPQNVDYLILEGTSIGSKNKLYQTEEEIEQQFIDVLNKNSGINIIYTSSQNIDRIVSIYKACLQTDKTLVVDVYVASILKELSFFAKIPFPSENFKNLKVMFPYYTSKKLTRDGNEKLLYQFKQFKITKEEISNKQENIIMLVRPSMEKDLDHIQDLKAGNFIYSMWEGYKHKSSSKQFIEYFKNRNFSLFDIHTSGHADVYTLKQMVNAINPKQIVPIHTFHAKEYKKTFDIPIIAKNNNKYNGR